MLIFSYISTLGEIIKPLANQDILHVWGFFKVLVRRAVNLLVLNSIGLGHHISSKSFPFFIRKGSELHF